VFCNNLSWFPRTSFRAQKPKSLGSSRAVRSADLVLRFAALSLFGEQAAEFERQSSTPPAAIRERRIVGTLTCCLKAVRTRLWKASSASARRTFKQQQESKKQIASGLALTDWLLRKHVLCCQANELSFLSLMRPSTIMSVEVNVKPQVGSESFALVATPNTPWLMPPKTPLPTSLIIESRHAVKSPLST